MVALIIGGGGLLAALTRQLPPERWRVPVGRDPSEQAQWLARTPVPPGKTGVILTDQPALWQSVTQAGWRVYWCSPTQIPIGAQPLPDRMLEGTVMDLAHTLWGVTVPDRRLVTDVMTGREETTGVVLSVTSDTGGVGKTVTCRRLAERAAGQGLRTLLVDGNMRQSSQRSFFDPMRRQPFRTIYEWHGGKPFAGANQGRALGVRYDVSFAPPTGVTCPWKQYAMYLAEARRYWQFIVLDLDRVSAADFDEAGTAAHDLLTPLVTHGDPCLVIVKAGVQTQGDALGLLSALPSYGLPRELIGVKDTIPVGMAQAAYHRLDYGRYGTFLGSEFQSERAGAHIAAGESGWADDGLDLVREQVLAWALPGRGFDPSKVRAPKRKGWRL